MSTELVNVKMFGQTGAVPTPTRPYHHGNLRSALIAAAVAEIESAGAARLSLREIARRAGVSHAAPAHHFGGKTGVFTAIAAEGFGLLAERTGRRAGQPDALLATALAYIEFGVEHRGYFEVMWRPDLHDASDPGLAAARDRAFEIFYATVGTGTDSADPDALRDAAVAAWSAVHGFVVLWLSGNLPAELGRDPAAAALSAARGMIAVGRATERQLSPEELPSSE
ncbi:MAG: TetR/AcrR family transcriptional regulator [Streptosporangiales bacterium]|nr:TetR/AcrR family transcriptional regulator [Streptosporangiales bacterium]